jgi:hypothetical protein
LLTTARVGIAMGEAMQSIQQAFEDGEIPVIVIENGIAHVDAPQPVILVDVSDPDLNNSALVVIDTTGQIEQIDRSRYNTGFLLTRTELHILNNNGRYEVLPLLELHALFERDPIIVNAETVSQAWGVFSIAIVIGALVFLVLWHSIVRLMFLALIALLVWGFVSLIRPNTGFSPIIITGLYAVVPAVYLSNLFGRSDTTFPGLQTLLLIIFWSAGLIASLAGGNFLAQERPMRLWTALIGLPMIILIIVDVLVRIPDPYGPITLWSVTLLTGLTLGGVRLYFRWKEMPKPEPSP